MPRRAPDDPTQPPSRGRAAAAARRAAQHALRRHLLAWDRRRPRAAPVSILTIPDDPDTETLADWAQRQPTDVNVTLLRDDPRRLMDLFQPDAFDYVHAGPGLHRFQDIEVLTILRMMDRIARRGVVWTDLLRSPAARLTIRALSLGRSPTGNARVTGAGFTRHEVLDIRRRVGLDYCRLHRTRLPHCFALAGQRQGAWVLGVTTDATSPRSRSPR